MTSCAKRHLTSLLIPFALLAIQRPCFSQDAGTASKSRIVGSVLDARTEQPIQDLTLTLEPLGRTAITDGNGRFQIRDLPAGEYTLRLDHVAYGTQSLDVDVPPKRTVAVDIPLTPQAIEMEPLEVRVDVDIRDPYLERRGYYERKDWAEKVGMGNFLEGDEIQQRGTAVDQVLSTMPNLRKIGGGGQRGIVAFNRHRMSFYGGPCLPSIYLDGRKIVESAATGPNRGPRAGPSGGALADYLNRLGFNGINSLVAASDIAAIEIYEGPASTPGEFLGADSRCGVIALWTRRGPQGS